MRKDYKLAKRKYVIGGIVLAVACIYIVRLFSLQVLNDDYKQYADGNAFLKKTQYPSRGLIYDRTGKLLVFNQPAYDVMMIVREVRPFDTLDFCRTLGITREQFDKRMEDMKNPRLNPGYSSYTPQTFMTQLSAQDYGRLQEKLYRFPGFFIQNRMLRQYAYPVAANVLGNIREVSPRDIERDDYYKRGDYTGDLGIERSYEQVLRGEKGVEILLRDAHGRIKGRYEDGRYDVAPVSGKNLKLSIDIELQAYGEKLMQNKIGAIVAIEPSTGEVLAMVSSPTYDPSMLVGRERGKNYLKLNRDKYKPLYDRALMAAYPPGSTFKPTQGLIFLNEGIITENTLYPCYHGFVAGRLKVGCHGHASPLALRPALQTSCNAFFCYGLRSMIDNRTKYKSAAEAFNIWKDYLVSMGYGYRLGIDLPGESRGFIPNSNYYNNSWMNYYNYYGSYNNYYYNNYESYLDDDKYVQLVGFSVGWGKRLRWPDDYFQLSVSLAYQRYMLKDWQYFIITNGNCNNINLGVTLSRTSTDNQLFPRRGSEFLASVTLTPPWSLWDGKDYEHLATDANSATFQSEQEDKYRWIEYHKWKFKFRNYTALTSGQKCFVLMSRVEFGLLGSYNRFKKSPFETFYMGGDGMSGYSSGYAQETIGLRGYENGSLTPYSAPGYAYDRFTLELRYPFMLGNTTIYGLAFLEGGNAWYDTKKFNPFDMKRSAGAGVRIFLPMVGLMGIDWAYGFDEALSTGTKGGSQFHFVLGQEF